MFVRYSANRVREALEDTPVVFVMGPRQSGKTTLIKSIISNDWEYVTFDDQTQLEAAKKDPVGFIRNLPSKPIALDEVQRIPELFLSIKQSVDEQRRPGRFLLTGSANALLLPKLSDSLAGRMETVKLLPLSESEILGRTPTFLRKVLTHEPPRTEQVRIRNHLINRIVTGGFPEPLQRKSEHRKTAWYNQYVNALIQRDIRDLGSIHHPEMMNKFIKLEALHVGKLVNYSELGSKLGIAHTTAKKYLSLLEQLFLFELLPAWHNSETRRLVKTPKLHAIDTGFICAARGISQEGLRNNPNQMGPLLESFVFNELRKQAEWLNEPIVFSHYRDKDKVEVDLVLENTTGECFGIEIKAAASLSSRDFIGLNRLKNTLGQKFKFGVLLYDGDHTTAFGDRLFAVPLATLWS